MTPESGGTKPATEKGERRDGSANRGIRRASMGERVWALVGALALASPLVVASRLRADPEGMGTHTQLGMPPCGWIVAYGRPCPTCGMTTAFTHAAHGDFVSAAGAQPGGLLLAVLAAAGFWVCLHTAVTGSRAVWVTLRALTPWRAGWLVSALGAAWAYKWWTYRSS